MCNDWLSFDHTFKLAGNIGYLRDGKWVNQYNSCFFVLNKKSEVVGWQFTSGVSFEEVSSLLSGIILSGIILSGINSWHIKAGIPTQRICVDNFCQARHLIQKNFGFNTTVHFDIFHAVQRISITLAKKSEPYSSCLGDLSMVFRSTTDSGKQRMSVTSPPQAIWNNLEE